MCKNINSDDDEDAYVHGDAKSSREMESVWVRQSRRQLAARRGKKMLYRNVLVWIRPVSDLGILLFFWHFSLLLLHVVSPKNAEEYSIEARSRTNIKCTQFTIEKVSFIFLVQFCLFCRLRIRKLMRQSQRHHSLKRERKRDSHLNKILLLDKWKGCITYNHYSIFKFNRSAGECFSPWKWFARPLSLSPHWGDANIVEIWNVNQALWPKEVCVRYSRTTFNRRMTGTRDCIKYIMRKTFLFLLGRVE